MAQLVIGESQRGGDGVQDVRLLGGVGRQQVPHHDVLDVLEVGALAGRVQLQSAGAQVEVQVTESGAGQYPITGLLTGWGGAQGAAREFAEMRRVNVWYARHAGEDNGLDYVHGNWSWEASLQSSGRGAETEHRLATM